MPNKVNAKLYKLQDNLIQIHGDSENFINSIIEIYNDKTSRIFKSINLREDLNQIVCVDDDNNNYFYVCLQTKVDFS